MCSYKKNCSGVEMIVKSLPCISEYARYQLNVISNATPINNSLAHLSLSLIDCHIGWPRSALAWSTAFAFSVINIFLYQQHTIWLTYIPCFGHKNTRANLEQLRESLKGLDFLNGIGRYMVLG